MELAVENNEPVGGAKKWILIAVNFTSTKFMEISELLNNLKFMEISELLNNLIKQIESFIQIFLRAQK